MSKKHKKHHSDNNQDSPVPGAYSAHAAEYRIIKHDLIRVIILNTIYLAGALALYYTNQKSHYLERWFGNIIHF